jgi:hypothetical protein
MSSREELLKNIDDMLNRQEEMDSGIPNLERAKKVLANKTPQESAAGLKIPRGFHKHVKNEVAKGNKIVRFVAGDVLLTDPPEYTASLWILTPKGELQERGLSYQPEEPKLGWA